MVVGSTQTDQTHHHLGGDSLKRAARLLIGGIMSALLKGRDLRRQITTLKSSKLRVQPNPRPKARKRIIG